MPTTPTTRRLKGPTCRDSPRSWILHAGLTDATAPSLLPYLDVDPRPQQVAHLLQDLLLQSVPGDGAVHVEHKGQPKPAHTPRVGADTSTARMAKLTPPDWITSSLGGHYRLCCTPAGSFSQAPCF